MAMNPNLCWGCGDGYADAEDRTQMEMWEQFGGSRILVYVHITCKKTIQKLINRRYCLNPDHPE